MRKKRHFFGLPFCTIVRATTVALATTVVFALTIVLSQSARAQTYIVNASPAQILTTLYSFCSQDNCADGAGPYAGLVQSTDGNFYGITWVGGAYNQGTVFKITFSGTLSTLYSFCSQANCADGANPAGGLVQANDGNFYGTTADGGDRSNCYPGCGTVFKITSGGTLTTLHSFDGTDGSYPTAGLVQSTDGNIYGTTDYGGASDNCTFGCGTVFKITPSGTLTALHSFSGSDGYYPGGLVQASDGNFYGTTVGGNGTVFKITPSGTLTTLHSFSGDDGYFPTGLVQASDGNFYGTTQAGGANDKCYDGCGTVFEITHSGMLTTLHSFSGGDGYYPAGLIQATDGSFYGTTTEGGAYGNGTVFGITPSGALTTLHSFDGSDGAPPAGFIQATDGNFYGTTYYGGAHNDGTAFRLVLPRPCIVCPTTE